MKTIYLIICLLIFSVVTLQSQEIFLVDFNMPKMIDDVWVKIDQEFTPYFLHLNDDLLFRDNWLDLFYSDQGTTFFLDDSPVALRGDWLDLPYSNPGTALKMTPIGCGVWEIILFLIGYGTVKWPMIRRNRIVEK